MAKSIHSLSDNELIALAHQVADAIALDPPAYGATPASLISLNTSLTQFETDVTAQTAAIAAAKASTATKDTSRTPVEDKISTHRDTAKAAKASDALMAALGLPSGSDPSPSNATVPAGAVDTSERMRHTISWTDAASLDNKKKPRGAMGVEIWFKLDGPPPTDEKDCTFLTLDAFTPYVATYSGAEGGKTVHYMLRWRMRDGTTLAWGETVSATITG